MVTAKDPELSLEEFLSLPSGETGLELIEGRAVPKVAPRYHHSRLQAALLSVLDPWAEACGHVGPEWGVVLQRQGKDWVPIPDVLYVSFERLAADWAENDVCPVAPELVIEIRSPDQTFREFVVKAGDYLSAGVDRVWLIDPQARSLSVFFPDRPPQTLTGEQTCTDPLFPDLRFSVAELFARARLPGTDRPIN
jgi:Uma2 family endonuclease